MTGSLALRCPSHRQAHRDRQHQHTIQNGYYKAKKEIKKPEHLLSRNQHQGLTPDNHAVNLIKELPRKKLHPHQL